MNAQDMRKKFEINTKRSQVKVFYEILKTILRNKGTVKFIDRAPEDLSEGDSLDIRDYGQWAYKLMITDQFYITKLKQLGYFVSFQDYVVPGIFKDKTVNSIRVSINETDNPEESE